MIGAQPSLGSRPTTSDAERDRRNRGAKAMLCVLEASFPHVVQRLQLCWGDPEAFDEMFGDLMLDKRGDRTGWPLDAWAELNFLQSIHHLAYGAAKHRAFRADPIGASWIR
jgi:hypothetical protein